MKTLVLLLVALLAVLVRQSLACGFSSCGGGCGCAPVVRNSCCGGSSCGGCLTSRRVTTARTKRDVRHHTVTLVPSDEDDPRCNSAAIGHIMKKLMSGNPEKSRLLIHEAIEEKSPHHFAVICSLHPFYYIADSKQYCAHTNNSTNETCYAFEF